MKTAVSLKLHHIEIPLNPLLPKLMKDLVIIILRVPIQNLNQPTLIMMSHQEILYLQDQTLMLIDLILSFQIHQALMFNLQAINLQVHTHQRMPTNHNQAMHLINQEMLLISQALLINLALLINKVVLLINQAILLINKAALLINQAALLISQILLHIKEAHKHPKVVK